MAVLSVRLVSAVGPPSLDPLHVDSGYVGKYLIRDVPRPFHPSFSVMVPVPTPPSIRRVATREQQKKLELMAREAAMDSFSGLSSQARCCLVEDWCVCCGCVELLAETDGDLIIVW